MINVDVVVTESFKSITGVNQVLRREVNNHDYFSNNGVNTTTFVLDSIPCGNSEKKKSSALISCLKRLARWLGLHCWLYSTLRFFLIVHSSKRIITYYLSLQRHPDIIVFHSIYDCYQYLKYKNPVSKKVVLFVHADSLNLRMVYSYFPKLEGTVTGRWITNMCRNTLNEVDRIVSISAIAKDNWLTEYPEFFDKISVAVNGIEPLTYEQQNLVNTLQQNDYQYKYRLICSGSINGRKGQWLVIHALANLNNDILDQIHLIIVGDGPERSELERYVKVNKLENNVMFTGSVPNDRVIEYLAISNIYVLMSNSEGLPISIIEALRCGLPVISTNVAGIPETVQDNVNGLLIERSVNAMTYTLQNLHMYDWEKFAHNSKQIFEDKFTYDRMKSDYVEILKQVLL